MSNWGRKFRRAKDRKLGLVGQGVAGCPCPGCKGSMSRIGCRNMICKESVDHTYDIIERARRRILGQGNSEAFTVGSGILPGWASRHLTSTKVLDQSLDMDFGTPDDYAEGQKVRQQWNNEESQRITKPKGKRDKGKQAWTLSNNS